MLRLSTESASRVKQPAGTGKHIFVLYKLAPVGLLDASLHAFDEACLIFEHAGNSVFHQLLGVLAIGRGHLLEPPFNAGREMYFLPFKIRENRWEQWRCTRSPVV